MVAQRPDALTMLCHTYRELTRTFWHSCQDSRSAFCSPHGFTKLQARQVLLLLFLIRHIAHGSLLRLALSPASLAYYLALRNHIR